MSFWETVLQPYRARSKLREQGKQEAMNMLYGTPEERMQKAMGLLGEAPGAYQLGSDEQFGNEQIPGLQTAGSGLLGSDMDIGDRMKFRLGMLGTGYSPQDVQSVMAPALAQQQLNQPLTQKDRFSMEQDLAKQRTTMLKPYMEQRQAAQKTMTALEQRTGAGDLAAVISFNKSLDPSSVVRESEQKAVTGVAGPIERFRALLQDVQGEGTLTDDTRAMLASLIEEIQINEAQNANNIIADYESRAKGYSLDPMAIRGGQLGYDPQGQPISRFSSIRAPETILNAQERARAELRRRGAL